MKTKKLDEPIFSTNFWYDVFESGYIVPEDLLEDADDIKRVKLAIETLKEFKSSVVYNNVEIG